MRIAICDDNVKIHSRLEEEVQMIADEMKVNMEVTCFSDGESLLDVIKENENEFDILLLDVDMPGVSGLEVAKILREMESNVMIIFVSAYENYVFDSIKYGPFRYIRKFRVKEELPLALRAAEELLKKEKERYIVIKGEDREYKVPHSKICYFEIENRKLNIYLTDGEVIGVWKTIKDFLTELDDENFVKIHSGCGVNIKYIKEYSPYDITIDNDKKILASRAGIKAVKGKLQKYWSEHI